MLYSFDKKGQSDVTFGTQADIVESTTTRRFRPILHGVNYNKKALEYKLVFGSLKRMDWYKMQTISLWLLGHQDYKWLQICQPDMENVLFRCLIKDLTPITVRGLAVAYEATIRCDSAYTYSFPFSYIVDVSGYTTAIFKNESTVREFLKPELVYNATASGPLKIINKTDGNREFSISNLSNGNKVRIDNLNGIIENLNGTTSLYDGFNQNFFRLVQGDNELSISGNGTLTISGRFLHNGVA